MSKWDISFTFVTCLASSSQHVNQCLIYASANHMSRSLLVPIADDIHAYTALSLIQANVIGREKALFTLIISRPPVFIGKFLSIMVSRLAKIDHVLGTNHIGDFGIFGKAQFIAFCSIIVIQCRGRGTLPRSFCWP